MIPHIFHRQRPGRPIDHRTINQTQNDVRRLAITIPGPGWGAFGSPGGLISRVASTGDLIGQVVEAITPRQDPVPGSSSDTTLGQGTVYQVGASTGEDSIATLTVDTSVELPVYNLAKVTIPAEAYIVCRRMWNLWIALVEGTDIFQAQTPTGGVSAATGSQVPYSPKTFMASVYTLDANGDQVAANATIYNNAPVALAGNKMVLVKSNGDGSFSVINQVC